MATGRHRKIVTELPAWVDALSPKEGCLRSVAEDAYQAEAFAKSYGADQNPKCSGVLRAARKSLTAMENPKAKSGVRCKEGDRAARKFWEAKVCARAR